MNLFSWVQGLFKLQGSDGTVIGNSDDRLKVVSTSEGSAVDAFGRVRYSQPSVVFDAYFIENDRPLLFSTKTTGSATISRNSTERCMELTVSSSGDKAIHQTRKYLHYVPGQSFSCLFTGVCPSTQSNLRTRRGYFDDDNGLFFEFTSSGPSVVVRDNGSGSTVDTAVLQTNWNLDTMDGNGPSGITLDQTKDNIYVIDFQWLGAGKIRFGVSIDGAVIYVHEIDNSNQNTRSYMATGNLPLRHEIEATGSISGTPKLKIFCMSVITEGNFDAIPSQHVVDTDGTLAIDISTFKPIIAIRLKSGNVRGQLIPKLIDAIVTTNDDVNLRVYYNATITGGSWVSAGTNSIAEYNKTITSVSGGEYIDGAFISKSGGVPVSTNETFLSIASDIDGTPDTLVVTAKSLTSSASMLARIIFEELY